MDFNAVSPLARVDAEATSDVVIEIDSQHHVATMFRILAGVSTWGEEASMVQADDLRRALRRDELFELVRTGQMEPSAAEETASAEGLSPLLRQPDPAQFDPQKQADWRYLQTHAWVMRRTDDAVREQDPRWRAASSWWVKSGQGFIAQQRPAPSYGPLVVADAWFDTVIGRPNTSLMDFEQAEAALREACLSTLSSFAYDVETGRLVEIPRHEWHRLAVYESRGTLSLRYEREPWNVRYFDPFFRRTDVLIFFPAPSPAEQDRRAAEQQASWHLQLLIAERADAPIPREQVVGQLKAKFGITNKAAQAIWSAETSKPGAEAWRRGGRRRRHLVPSEKPSTSNPRKK